MMTDRTSIMPQLPEKMARAALAALLLWTSGSVMPVLDRHQCDESARLSPWMAVHLWRCHDRHPNEDESNLGWHMHFMPIDADDFTGAVAGGTVPPSHHEAVASPVPALIDHECGACQATLAPSLEFTSALLAVRAPARAHRFLQTYSGGQSLRLLTGVFRC